MEESRKHLEERTFSFNIKDTQGRKMRAQVASEVAVDHHMELMAFHRRRSVKSKPLACLLVGLSFLALGQWFLQVSTSQQKKDAERRELAALVALEAREHSDVLQWAFADTFLNLTLKHVHLLNWLAVRCPHARFLLSGDDDVFVHTANVVSFLEAQPPDSHLFVGQLMSGSVPIRDSWSKYFVPPQLFSGPAYPVYCSGGGFLLSHYTIQALHRAARHTPLFPIDDAYMGMCLERAGLAPSGHEGIRPFGVHMPGARQPSFDPCVYRNLLLVHRFVPYEMLLMWKALHDSGLSCSQGHRVS
ncbi:Acetylgalactosaminyl-O-glycosyl-glycoprotein beta-1; 3-N-acetylglucosaminyltransferase [Camelus dromedarius]|uniref:Hexosyltransferase n=1 Tax=Camelus dromedarius TaxID=9838 RepID=A0A5N4DNV3_CAMDR|nr:Acetylgalactosaminyl-O-glycosyl-glycoprotein beta-1; 3-N-acetylglucosaminyltransferase [Camelus dromedarius]